MKVLLDTHALIWALSEPARLGGRARSLLEDRSVGLLVSAVSAWEIATKVRIGKLLGADALIDGWAGHIERLGAEELPLDSSAALRAGSMSWSHRDPFDRMLAAQAIAHDVVLLTRDEVFSDLPTLRVRW